MEQIGLTDDSGIIKNLNIIIIGLLIILLMIILLAFSRIIMGKMKTKIRRKIKKFSIKLKIKVFHSVHQVV